MLDLARCIVIAGAVCFVAALPWALAAVCLWLWVKE